MAHRFAVFVFALVFAYAGITQPQNAPAKSPHWVAAWTASAHGPYPVGNPTGQPEYAAMANGIDLNMVLRK